MLRLVSNSNFAPQVGRLPVCLVSLLLSARTETAGRLQCSLWHSPSTRVRSSFTPAAPVVIQSTVWMTPDAGRNNGPRQGAAIRDVCARACQRSRCVRRHNNDVGSATPSDVASPTDCAAYLPFRGRHRAARGRRLRQQLLIT